LGKLGDLFLVSEDRVMVAGDFMINNGIVAVLFPEFDAIGVQIGPEKMEEKVLFWVQMILS